MRALAQGHLAHVGIPNLESEATSTMKSMKFVSSLAIIALSAGAYAAPPLEKVLGKWEVVTDMRGRTQESSLILSQEGGELKAKLQSQRGERDALNPKYDNGTLTWDLEIPQLQGQAITMTVTVKDDLTFEGAAATPLGELPMTGKKVAEGAGEEKMPEAAAAAAAPGDAPALADIVGEWQMETDMGGRKNESTLTVSEENGQLKVVAGGRGGSLEGIEPKYENGELSWGLKIEALQGAVVKTTVNVAKDLTFKGAVATPIGEMPVTGKKITEEMLAKEAAAEDKMIGDWNFWTTYNNDQFGSKIRIQRENDGDLSGAIVGRGSRIYLSRMRVEGNRWSWSFGDPFLSDDPVRVVLDVDWDEMKFEGTVHHPVGDLPIVGELVDTEKLVLAPYDDPTAILGEWEVQGTINGEEIPLTTTFMEEGERLGARIEGPDGFALDVHNVEYKKVSDTMGVVRIRATIPDLGEEEQVYELIVDGDSFEGEELHSNGAQVLIGKKK